MDRLVDILAISLLAYVLYSTAYKKGIKPLLAKAIPKGIKHLDILYIVVLLLCLIIVPYKAGYTHFYRIIGTYRGVIDYYFLLYELLVITVVYILIRLIVKRTTDD